MAKKILYKQSYYTFVYLVSKLSAKYNNYLQSPIKVWVLKYFSL